MYSRRPVLGLVIRHPAVFYLPTQIRAIQMLTPGNTHLGPNWERAPTAQSTVPSEEKLDRRVPKNGCAKRLRFRMAASAPRATWTSRGNPPYSGVRSLSQKCEEFCVDNRRRKKEDMIRRDNDCTVNARVTTGVNRTMHGRPCDQTTKFSNLTDACALYEKRIQDELLTSQILSGLK